MAKEYEFQHYVQAAYLESWTKGKGLIIVDKENNKKFFKKPNNAFGVKDFYTIKAKDYLLLDNEVGQEIFSFLLEYDIFYQGKKLDSIDRIIDEFVYINDWLIYINGEKVDNKDVSEAIRNKRILSIEKGWHQYEEKWRKILEELNNLYNNSNYDLDSQTIEDLKDYMVVAGFRTPETVDRCEGVIRYMTRDFESEGLPEKFSTEFRKELTDFLFKKSILDYQTGEDLSIMKLQRKQFENIGLGFAFARGETKFYTCDSPVLTAIDENYKPQYTYFPVSPKILVCILYSIKNEKYKAVDIPSEIIQHTNTQIAEKAFRYYVEY